MVCRAYVTKGASGETGGSGSIGELIDAHGSTRALTLISDDTGAIYQVGVQEIVSGYVGKPCRWFTQAGYIEGRLFVDYPGSGTYSPPFHGIGDLPGYDAVPTKDQLARLFEIAGYPSSYIDAFEYDWSSATYGGSNLYEMMISDLRKKWPKVMIGNDVRRRFVLAGDPTVWKSWYLDIMLHFPFVTRDDPHFDSLAYTDGLFDYYKPYVLDMLDAQDNFEVSLQMTRVGSVIQMVTSITRRGFGYGVTNGDEYFSPGVSGFAKLEAPDVRLFVMPDGRVTIATNSRTAYPDFGYVNSGGWPLLRHDISSDAGKIDELSPHDIGGNKRRWYRRKGGYCFG